MKKIFLVILGAAVIVSCRQKEERRKPNTFLQVVQLINYYYDEDAPHIHVNGDETAVEVYDQLCALQTKSFQTWYLECESCVNSLPVQLIADACACKLKDIIPKKTFYFQLDSTFTVCDSRFMFESDSIPLSDLKIVLDSIMFHDKFYFNEILFEIETTPDVNITSVINLASYIQKVYMKRVFDDAYQKDLMLMSKRLRESFIEPNRFLLMLEIDRPFYYSCDCDSQKTYVGTRSGRY